MLADLLLDSGTAGVWRRATIADIGGWMARTTVEDMDLSLRAYLRGWQAIYLEDVTCLNEVLFPNSHTYLQIDVRNIAIMSAAYPSEMA